MDLQYLKMSIFVLFFLLVLLLGWIFFDEKDWGKPLKKEGAKKKEVSDVCKTENGDS